MPCADEEKLVYRARGGEAPAFEEIFRLYSGRVYSLCLRLTLDAALAEEITQDVFVQAWRKLASYRGESSVGAWLHRIAVNAVMDAHRARRRRELWLEAFRWVRRESTASESAGMRVDLETAISRLPIQARTVFVLHDVEGYKHEEIALMLGVAAGTCKAQLHQARRRLRKELEQ